MKKIIKNKIYDTNTAQKIGYYEFDTYDSINYICETLYQKKTGEFFLHSQGGANTKYSERISFNHWSSGETIIPLTYHEAMKWAENHLSAGKYEEIFGAIDESDEFIRKEFTLKKSTVAKIKRAASEKGISMQQLIENIFENY